MDEGKFNVISTLKHFPLLVDLGICRRSTSENQYLIGEEITLYSFDYFISQWNGSYPKSEKKN